MIDLVALFESKKIQSIEFYRSERFGSDNEEIWCEIDLLSTDWYTMTMYRKGYIVASNNDRLGESALFCLLNGRELTFSTSFFQDSKTKVGETAVWRDQIRKLIRSASAHIGAMDGLSGSCSSLEPSRYYPERKIKCPTDINRVTLIFTDGICKSIEMHPDSDDRMQWARDLKVIPQLYRSFIGPYTLKKISKEHLAPAELNELEFMSGSTLYTEKEMEFILEHLFRDENGDAYYAMPDVLDFFKLYTT